MVAHGREHARSGVPAPITMPDRRASGEAMSGRTLGRAAEAAEPDDPVEDFERAGIGHAALFRRPGRDATGAGASGAGPRFGVINARVVSGAMAYWGKIIGGFAGFVVGGPMGAVVGAALGHAAESGAARPAVTAGGSEQVFAVAVVAIAAKLAKCDGAVNRSEIDAFKRSFMIPPGAERDIGRWFDTARDSPEGPEPYAQRLAVAFAGNPALLEEVMGSLTAIAAADGPVNPREAAFLARVRMAMGLGETSARGPAAEDPYAVLGLSAAESGEALRARWRSLMLEHHPDSLAARGAAPELVAKAQDQVAKINAAWDRIKRERGL